ncbi:MAG: SCP2 sterol-binding domain-containing protein [Thermoplasmatota archaeon]
MTSEKIFINQTPNQCRSMFMSDEIEGRSVLEDMVEKFKKKIKNDDELREKVKDYDRKIMIDFKEDDFYNLEFRSGEVSDVREGPIDDADITIKTDPETLHNLLEGNMGAMEAYAKKKMKIDASLTDMLKIKNLL